MRVVRQACYGFVVFSVCYAQSVGIGTNNPHPRAILQLESTSQGFLPPRLTQAERDAIPSTMRPRGLVIYNTTTNCLEFWNGAQWISTCGSTAPCSPPPIQPPTANTPCLGGTLTLQAPSLNGVNIFWTGPNNYTATGANVSISNVTPSHAGTYCYKAFSTTQPCLVAEGCVNVTITAPPGTWVKKDNFPSDYNNNCFRINTFEIGDTIYLINGYRPGPPMICRLTYAFKPSNPPGSQWETNRALLPENKGLFTSFAIGNYGYATAGWHSFSPFYRTYRYDPQTDDWTDVGANYPHVSFNTSSRGATVWQNYAYSFSGTNNTNSCGSAHTAIVRYDPAQNQWQAVSNALAARMYRFVFTIGNYIYYGGGCLCSGPNGTNYYRYDPQTNQHTDLGTLPSPLQTCLTGYTAVGGYGYVWTGSRLYRFDPSAGSNGTWTEIQCAPTCSGNAASGAVLATVGGKIYFICPQANSAVWEWTP